MKTIWRYITSDIYYSLLHILGLTISMIVAIYIFVGIKNELSYDSYRNQNCIFKLLEETPTNTGTEWKEHFPGPLAPAAKEQIHTIMDYCRVEPLWIYEFIKNEQANTSLLKDQMQIASVDPIFFDMFDLQLLEGDKTTFLSDSKSIVISQSVSQSFFGKISGYGKMLTDNLGNQYLITGIVSDFPKNSSFDLNIYMPFKPFMNEPAHIDKWDDSNFETYFLVKGGDTTGIVGGIQKIYSNRGENKMLSRRLQPIKDTHLYNLDGTQNDILKECKLSFWIGILLLLMAGINYINITISRSSRRNKEIYIKLIYGAERKNMLLILLMENVVISFISIIAAGLLLYILNPVLNRIMQKDIVITIFSVETIVIFLITFLFIVIISGIYPAYTLSKRVSINGMLLSARKHSAFIRKALTIVQFTATAFLIICSITITKQLTFMKDKNLGYNPNDMVYIEMPPAVHLKSPAIKNELMKYPDILSVISVSSKINSIQNKRNFKSNGDDVINMRVLYTTDSNFFSVMGIKLLEGSIFKASTSAEKNNIYGSENFVMPACVNVIINQTAAKMIGGENIIGKTISFMGIDCNIIGIAQDFHIDNLKNKIEPLAIVNANFTRTGTMYMKLTSGQTPNAMRDITNAFKNIVPDFTFSVRSMNDDFQADYQNTLLSYNIINLFAVISIIISCLGLLGFIGYTLESRKKEIALRKVMGATIGRVIWNLQSEYIYLSLFSMLVAFPLAYTKLQTMLSEYAFHITITWPLYVLSGIILLLIVISTILYKTIKTASINPAEIMRQN